MGRKNYPKSKSHTLKNVSSNDVQISKKVELSSAVPEKVRSRRFVNEEYTKGLSTVFEKESKTLVEARKKLAQKPICRKLSSVINFYSEVIDIPKRPYWTFQMSRETIINNQKTMFSKYLKSIYSHYSSDQLNYFEHNLEVWCQLWRVCEISDVLIILADIRHPMFHFPPALYHYVVNDLKKPLILALTKIDLVPAENVDKWIKYFEENFPSLKVTSYSSYNKKNSSVALGIKKKKRSLIRGYQPVGVTEIIRIIKSLGIRKNEKLVPVSYEFKSQKHCSSSHLDHTNDLKLAEKKSAPNDDRVSDDDFETSDVSIEQSEAVDVSNTLLVEQFEEIEKLNFTGEREKKETDYIIIGLIGNPNVGKSTFINSMKRNKVCSTSRTPGHTKWKQTIFLNSHLMLVDCPGLVFPAIGMPKQLQILCGLFPVAQVREPYSAIGYAAQMVRLEEIYELNIGDAITTTEYDPNQGEIPWSAWMICEAYATKRGYKSVGGSLNIHRAGLEILYDIIDGRVSLYFLPNQVDSIVSVFYNEKRIFDPMCTFNKQISSNQND